MENTISDSRQGDWSPFEGETKLLVMGAFSVGKTSLIRRFINTDGESSVPTSLEGSSGGVDDYYRHDVYTDCEKIVQIDILDTTGDLEYSQILKLAIRTGDIFVLVYAIDDKNSFEKIHDIRDLIMKQIGNDKKVSIIVVGNKIDLQSLHHARCPAKDVVERVVEDWGYPYMEISTRDKDAVDNVFSEIVRRHGLCGNYCRRRLTSPTELMHTIRRRLLKRWNSFQ